MNMWKLSKRDRYIRSTLLTITCIVCISLISISLIQPGIKQKIIQKITKENAIVAERQTEEECIPVCDSRECILQANILLKSINPDVRPCENFQKFLCGTFEQTLGPDESGASVIRAHMMMLHKIKDVLENIAAPPGSASSKLKIMYDSCVNTGSSDLRGTEDFKQELNNVGIPNWPYLPENFTFSEADLPVLLGTLKSYAAFPFFQIIFSESIEKGSNTKITRVYYRNFLVRPLERDAATDILKYFDIDEDDIEVILNDYDSVSHTLANLHNENATACEENCNVHIDCSSPGDKAWEYVCKTVEVFANLTHQNDNVTKLKFVVDLNNIYSVKNFFPCLKSLPGRSVANYFALDFLWNHLDEVNFFFRRQKRKHFQYFRNPMRPEKEPEREIKSRWIYCIAWIVEYMKLPLENEYVQQYLRKSIIDEILEIHTNNTAEVGDKIAQQEWISIEPRSSMEHLIKNLHSNFLQLTIFPNETLVNEYMKMFNPTPESFFLNVLDHWKLLMTVPWDQERFITRLPSFDVNAAYADVINNIDYHFGIIFPPFFYPGYKRQINRILFSPVALHEIGHGVVGILSIISKSSNSTGKTFLEKKHCIENQFSKFEFKYLGGNLNGTQYLDENLADNLAQTFLDKLLESFDSSPDAFSLPGLLYPPKQQLYMSAKEEFCSKSSLEKDIHDKTEDTHAPLEYRIIGALQNSKGYAEAFHCLEGSYMNPTIKCSLLD